MSFDVEAEAYARFMGRYSVPLSSEFIRLVDPQAGQRALDVGCGPGALTAPLIERLGAAGVCAIDPSESFVAAARARFPDVNVRHGAAEDLPFADGDFDLTLAQLVVHFMADPVVGLGEMRRVTRPGGLVAASVWDYGSDRAPISAFWRAVCQMDPSVTGESQLAGASQGQLVELFTAAGFARRPAGPINDPGRVHVLRRVVGAIHAGRRTRGRPRRAAGRGTARRAEAAVRVAATERALRDQGVRVGRNRSCLSLAPTIHNGRVHIIDRSARYWRHERMSLVPDWTAPQTVLPESSPSPGSWDKEGALINALDSGERRRSESCPWFESPSSC
jgi:SAM-dependent methyltransferase